jgi:hypothetical protein
MKNYTNISAEPLGELYGIPIRPCMKSGFCCNKAPCGYGESISETEPGCKFLLPPNDIGQRDCGRYDWIVANVPGYEIYPAFGAGCCMPIGNEPRQQIIENIKKMKDGREL